MGISPDDDGNIHSGDFVLNLGGYRAIILELNYFLNMNLLCVVFRALNWQKEQFRSPYTHNSNLITRKPCTANRPDYNI